MAALPIDSSEAVVQAKTAESPTTYLVGPSGL